MGENQVTFHEKLVTFIAGAVIAAMLIKILFF